MENHFTCLDRIFNDFMEELSGAGEVILKSPLEIFSGILFPNFPTNTEYQTRKSHISKISRISRREKKDQHNDMVYFWRQNLTVLRLTKCRSFDYAHAPHKVHNWLLSMPQEFFFLWHKQTLFLMIYLRKHIDVLPSE